MNKEFLERKINEIFGTKAAFAAAIGIEPPSLSEWFKKGVIPASRISEVFNLLNIKTKDQKEIALNLPQLKLSFRAKRDILESEVPKPILNCVTGFSKTYFNLSSSNLVNNHLLEIKKEIAGSRDYKKVAKIIRSYLKISDLQPFDHRHVDFTLRNYGINLFFIPFESFNFISSENTLRALAANKGSHYLVLCDSGRTVDEVMFDATHELVHIFTGIVGETPISDETENFIDLITEELIYPEEFLKLQFPFLLEDGKRITQESFISHNLRTLVDSYNFFAPRGIAKTLKNLNLITKDQKVYTWLHDEEHERFLKKYGTSLTKIGKMDVDFRDTFQFEKFLKDNVLPDIRKYPLFYLLAESLVKNRITPRTFAEIFGMDSGDVDELRKELSLVETL